VKSKSQRNSSWRRPVVFSLLFGFAINVIFITQPIFATALDLAYEAGTAYVPVGYCDGGPGDGHGYCRRNCTSYTAYRLQAAGVSVTDLSYLGNGGQWYDNASKRGLPVGDQPRVGAAAVLPGNPGHVAYVEAINADGSIQVASYNGYTETFQPEAHATRYHHFVYFNPFILAAVSQSKITPPAPATPSAQPDPAKVTAPVATNPQAAASNTAAVKVLNGLASAAFVTPGTNPDNWQFLQADYDNDGVPDMVAINSDDNSHVGVVVVDGSDVTKTLLKNQTVLPAATKDWRFALADYNHDQTPDMYALYPQANGALQLTIIDGNDPSQTLFSGAVTGSLSDGDTMVVADYNDDKIPDIYLVNRRNWAAGKPAVSVIDGQRPSHTLQLSP
jgi:hypothetical protein